MASTGALMAVSGSADADGAFDVNKVLAPIVVAAAPPYLLVVSPTLPVASTADLIRLAKEKPEGLTFGSSGVGAASHLSGLLFASATGIKLLHLSHQGNAPAEQHTPPLPQKGPRPRRDRSARRPHRHDVRAGTGGAAVRPGRQVEGAGRHRYAALKILSGYRAGLRNRARL